MSFIGLDIGTTGCKSSLFDQEGRILSSAYREYPLEYPKPGHYELDPRRVWEAVRTILEETMASQNGIRVQALSISSLGETFVPVDREGRALASGILYTDVRGREETAILERKLGKRRIMELAGVPVHPMFSLPKMMWIKTHQPDVYARTWKFMLFGDYIAYLLTGAATCNHSLASRTMAFNVSNKSWEPVLLEAAGIELALLPDLIQPGGIIGQVRQDLAVTLGLQPDTLVVAGGHDQACAALGAGIMRDNQAIDGIGTVECITPAYSSPVLNETMLSHQFNCAPHVIEDMYLTYAFNFTGGSLLKWYRDHWGRHAEEEARKAGLGVYDYLTSTAHASPTDLLVVPHFAGSGTPFMNPEAKGVIYGLTLDTNAGQLYRALLEGVTYEMRYNLECLSEAGIPIDTLRAVGGGAKSDLWLQIKADIMNRPIERLNVSEAGTVGAIMLAGKAAGAYRSFDEAASVLVKPDRTFHPGKPNTELYQDRYEKYKKLLISLSNL
ncbi:FGGY-family carbohydrate kinase [Paenibacillus mendelii]|uniref:L-fuculokinase n=1 Tax=Paenibacillus mendelii TaxID=206163 RepID=A0ABV6J2F3_9BACL|nr:FGGY-family carbohydrate kinase [Paenibacillus mendelii]MCQ6560543.1 FGGY family carbohydrate kinase [Paenibacillus mendelii]